MAQSTKINEILGAPPIHGPVSERIAAYAVIVGGVAVAMVRPTDRFFSRVAEFTLVKGQRLRYGLKYAKS